MKKKSLKILLFTILFILFCNIYSFATEEYSSIQIGSNESPYVTTINLILSEHTSEDLYVTVKDKDYNTVTTPNVSWESSDSSIVTINYSGTIQAVKAGTATITVSGGGQTDTCTVKISDAPNYTDFSKANFSSTLSSYTETLKITGITPDDTSKTTYYLMVTSNNNEPKFATKNGYFDSDANKGTYEYLSVNSKENYLYTNNLSKYSELNQDLYIWIIQDVKLPETYYDKKSQYISHSCKFVVKGKKIDKAALPQLNVVLNSFSIGYWNSTSNNSSDSYTYMNFNYPTATEKRKFNIKIGKITDSDILNKIKNNDYSGITKLLTYAKNNSSIYNQTLTTTSQAYFRSDTALFDGRKLLEHKAYYYIYVNFDSENGKYRPVEAVTLGQAWHSSSSTSWDLWAYTSENFKWENLTPTYTPTDPDPTPAPTPNPTPQPTPNTQNPQTPAAPNNDSTAAKTVLPAAGATKIIIAMLIIITILVIFFHNRCNYYKGIK